MHDQTFLDVLFLVDFAMLYDLNWEDQSPFILMSLIKSMSLAMSWVTWINSRVYTPLLFN